MDGATPGADTQSQRMTTAEALSVLAAVRRDVDVVVTNQRASREWPFHSRHELDFNYNPSAMGGAVPLALGLALAQPRRHVLCLSGDGSLLMNLGCLVTVAASGADNLTIVLLDNGIYEITGGQQVPAAAGGVDYAGLARAAGIRQATGPLAELAVWQQSAAELLAAHGPRFLWLQVRPEPQAIRQPPPCSIVEQVTRLRSAL